MANSMPSMPSMDGAPGGRRRRFSLFMGVMALVVVSMACSEAPVLQQAPAHALSLNVGLSDDGGARPTDKVSLVFFFEDGKQAVRLSGKQRLTCDGVDLIPHSTPGPILSAYGGVTRQPPGGVYTCHYTDENGKQTTFFIPEPTGHLAITSPRAGAMVPMPWRDEPPPYFVTPTATPVAPVLHDPFTIAYTLPGVPTSQHPVGPTGIHAIVYGCVDVTPPPSCGVETEGEVAEAWDEAPAQTGTLLVGNVPVPQDTGYHHLVPGPGQVDLFLFMKWTLAPQGFRSIHVDVEEHVITTFTWVAATQGAAQP